MAANQSQETTLPRQEANVLNEYELHALKGTDDFYHIAAINALMRIANDTSLVCFSLLSELSPSRPTSPFSLFPLSLAIGLLLCFHPPSSHNTTSWWRAL